MNAVCRRRPCFPTWLQGGMAACAAALIVVLAVLAASPALHGRLHHHAGDADHECAVTLFQHGTVAAVAAIAVAAVAWVWLASVAITPVKLDLDRGRYWLPPANAPPAVG